MDGLSRISKGILFHSLGPEYLGFNICLLKYKKYIQLFNGYIHIT